MATAADYAINFPYGATSAPYSSSRPHRGDDRPCPSGTPVVIGNKTIGLTGATGYVFGAHLHIQEWQGDYANTRKPQNAFQPGIVTNIDPNITQGDKSFGKFITIKNADGWNDSYCHLSEIFVAIGDVIGGTALQPNQRIIENNTGVNQRSEPNTGSRIIKDWPYDLEPFTFKGYVEGESVNGNNVWFVGAFSGGYFWSGAFVDKSTNGLSNLTPPPVVIPPDPKPDVFPVPTSDPLVTKVYNKRNPVGDYEPTDLVTVGGQKLRQEAAASLLLMQAKTGLQVASGYRSKATQQTVYDNYVQQDGKEAADRYSARPGYSEHQTGLAMDFSPIDDSFATSDGYKWLMSNAHKYGWVLRYPADKEAVTGYMSEPWHWRYVGVTVATDMKSKSITTLEEYYKIEGGDYPTTGPTPGDVDQENNTLLKQILAIVQWIKDKLGGVFK